MLSHSQKLSAPSVQIDLSERQVTLGEKKQLCDFGKIFIQK